MISLNMRFLLFAATLLLVCSSSLKAEEAAKLSEEPITEADREHWSFQPIKRPALPVIKNQTWSRTPVDHFILAELEVKSLEPAPEASRTTLIRRLYFDVIGLPPMPEEVEAFLADQSPHAYEKLVDRLLSSKHYGERWAQHWLDLARFAETDGYEHDKVRPDAWKFRDWVIKALNDD
ncbi:MAG: DUF1549 domain-containing protein, partial [Planctomycetaceae bacterium]|nr:DUF1549 domain-containing protein [Planctomycetaceae bacterium]